MRVLLLFALIFSRAGASAQSATDSLLAVYANNLPGTWLRENTVIDGRGNATDTSIKTLDTLVFSRDGTYRFRTGANTDKHWTGVLESGHWFLEAQKKSGSEVNIVVHLNPLTSNIPLPLQDYVFTIVDVNAVTFSYYYYNRLCVYRRE